MSALPARRQALDAPASGRALALTRLDLADFRNYRRLDMEPGCGIVVLHGDNGAGKTNLLEAASLLTPGRGLRRAKLSDLDRQDGGPWRVRCRAEGHDGPVDLETRRAAEGERREVLIDGQPLRSQTELGSYLSVVWLTPSMDRLFTETASGRRRFLDRLVLAIDPSHATRVASFERAMRERSHLLRGGRRDTAWLDAIERRMAEAAVAVAAARRDLVTGLAAMLEAPLLPLPYPRLAVTGDVEGWLEVHPALEVEQKLIEAWRRSRAVDGEAGGAAIGPHRSDLVAIDAASADPAQRCSTGRQKCLLISIVLAEARLRQERQGDLPILLLDEVTAHLDPGRRLELFAALEDLGAQVWLTGTEADLFAPLRGSGRFYQVAHGALRPDD